MPTSLMVTIITASSLLHKSFQQREAFIATQAPLDTTVVDFWRMTWEYEANCIVMLCTQSEREEGICVSYSPHKEEFIVYGLLMIEIEAEDLRNGFCRRTENYEHKER
ncbi:tyrosine-protein phosphatase 2-like isoform X2 [Pocillopora verrucosa]|uniref:tyrosine-protein phosphatase 2-like isoform X2 n=1 Tax=Pocillopora verrucosa TaxID=203993 RepID=UPI00333ED79A